MCHKLPNDRPKIDNNDSKYTNDYILNLDPNGEYCYIFVVDIHYPSKLHDRDFEFPILCDKLIPSSDKIKKLMSTFHDKENYTISLHMLKYCLKRGLKLKKYIM